MFTLELYDRLGQKLSIGDIVKISDGHKFQFFAEVKYLADEQCITPFHTFSFHSFEKVDKVPENAILLDEKRYNVWSLQDPEIDTNAEAAQHYLIEWRCCEKLLEQRIYRIKLNTQPTLF